MGEKATVTSEFSKYITEKYKVKLLNVDYTTVLRLMFSGDSTNYTII